ncbi:hypothetical protein KQI88_00725 [Alkaliphilus sp. MSJ-5]|uniref:Lipoprotein n=1 Tax=Alkaliphilus flagellatus TaxID=2841507 RepID=A0ABS6FZX0_9FIRM|nr:hypothetical protein [Alkaliphilus flagellatus]MBU5674938.1 hypothetical protein [Alkaliphilus flagellatus]
MKKRIMVIILLSLITLNTSCNYRKEGDIKKVVLQKDISKDSIKEDEIKIVMEEIDLELEEGEYFEPSFYHNGDVYGYIHSGFGIVHSERSTEQFPIGGQLKEHLYRLQQDNTLKETTKKVFMFNIHDPKTIGYELYKDEPKLLAIDYLKQDEPLEMKDLDNALSTLEKDTNTPMFKKNTNTYIRETVIDEDTTYLTIMAHVPYEGHDLYFYDIQKKQLYRRRGNISNGEHVEYIQALKSFICLDDDLKSYKVVFKDNEYDFIEYIDLNKYTNNLKEIDSKARVGFFPINDEEVLIWISEPFRLGGYFDYHPSYQTKAISSFNFKTNQFEELFAAKEGQYVDFNYVGTVESIGRDLFIIDEFQESDGNIVPKKRTFKIIADGQLNTIYEENIEDEGITLNSYLYTLLSEDGKEIFLNKVISTMENKVETSKDAIYKKYTFE